MNAGEATKSVKAHASIEIDPVPTRVLVVDDDERNLLTISEVLKGVGEITQARSGEQALRYLLKSEFAVILLDVLMPGIDGYQTAELIRQRESSKSTPIIFLTAINKEDAHMLRGYGAGAVDFLFKPFNPAMLRSKVAVFVDLFQKTREIKLKAAREQRLLEENLNVNARKLEAEIALRRAEERQEAILRSLPICLHSRGLQAPFGLTFVSEAAEGLTGYPSTRLTENAEFALALVHPADRPQFEAALSNASRTGAYACQFRLRCADDQYRYFLDQGVVTRDEVGRPREILGTLLDVTERRQLEDQLMHAQKLEAIGQLTGGVAHDFNNLLASILSGLSLIKRKVDMNDSAHRIFDMTEHAAKQGAELIARMLTFSRRQDLHPAPVSISDLWTTLDSLLEPILGGMVLLKWEIAEEPWHALADRSQLELAVTNLVINARDAMPNGGTISLRALNRTLASSEGELAAADYVVLQVADTGSGILPEHIEKVFEPFFTTKEVGRGTGLGLSTAYGFAKQSGGTLRVESAPGMGTTVELWLRRADQSSDTVPLSTGASDAMAPLPSGKTVLLVDDNRELSELTSMILKERGLSVVSASGGAEAFSILEGDPDRYDVIVTDFAMPIVSGTDLINKARKVRAGWPCILITGYADESSISQRPADVPLVRKPYEPDELINALRQIL